MGQWRGEEERQIQSFSCDLVTLQTSFDAAKGAERVAWYLSVLWLDVRCECARPVECVSK